MKVLVSMGEARRLLGISRQTMYRWIKDGVLHGEQAFGKRGVWKFELDEIKRLIPLKAEITKPGRKKLK